LAKKIEMSRVVVFDEIGGPGPGEVRLRVEAFGVNRADQMLRAGVYAYLPPPAGTPRIFSLTRPTRP
jgi:NADPH:quinone reductase-like Zn-dependent oxidoreductase